MVLSGGQLHCAFFALFFLFSCVTIRSDGAWCVFVSTFVCVCNGDCRISRNDSDECVGHFSCAWRGLNARTLFNTPTSWSDNCSV